ncbi:MAG TPA: hypothetical protein VG652_12875 [Gaiellaceae bacterium]|nr:hypothetical protein [Gaiellaceae bacterium]
MLAVAILAGCGGSSGGKGQLVQGDGFRFTAPSGWSVQHTHTTWVARSGQAGLVQASSFRTVKPYRSALFEKLPKELGRVAGSLASDLGGKVAGHRRVVVDGRQSWSYRLASAGSVTDVTFVFVGRQEFQLLCRRPQNGDTAPCQQLLSSFAIG